MAAQTVEKPPSLITQTSGHSSKSSAAFARLFECTHAKSKSKLEVPNTPVQSPPDESSQYPDEKDMAVLARTVSEPNKIIAPLTQYDSSPTTPLTRSPSDEQIEAQLLDQATAFIPTSPIIPDHVTPLAKPVLIPRLTKGITAPVARAWPPQLADHAVSQEEFISFIDNLNIMSRPTSATIVLSLAAIGISFIPWDGAEGIAFLTELAAIGIGYYTVWKRYTGFLNKMNEDYFHPRKLHARLVLTPKMRKVFGIADDDPLIAPLEEAILTMTAHERCMEQLKPYCCELSYDVPEPTSQTKLLAKCAAWNCGQEQKKANKSAQWARKRAWKKMQAGKTVKREGYGEKYRVKKLQWLVVQNLEDWKKEEAERIRLEKEKPKRAFTWKI